MLGGGGLFFLGGGVGCCVLFFYRIKDNFNVLWTEWMGYVVDVVGDMVRKGLWGGGGGFGCGRNIYNVLGGDRGGMDKEEGRIVEVY